MALLDCNDDGPLLPAMNVDSPPKHTKKLMEFGKGQPAHTLQEDALQHANGHVPLKGKKEKQDLVLAGPGTVPS
jgi:hypothetical protein